MAMVKLEDTDPTVVVLLRASKSVWEGMRAQGFHSGYSLRADGLDSWYTPIVEDPQRPRDQKVAKLKEYVETLRKEVALIVNGVVTLWHPLIDVSMLSEAGYKNVYVIEAPNVVSGLSQRPRLPTVKESDILVVTVQAYEHAIPAQAGWLLESAKRNGITLHVIGAKSRFQSLVQSKLEGLYRELRATSGYSHILFVDGSDTLFASGIQEIYRKWRSLNNPIVFGSELWCHPWPKRIEPLVPNQHCRSKYLNSGMFMGTWDAAMQAIEGARGNNDPYQENGYGSHFDDQCRFQLTWLNKQAPITLDYRSELFQNTCGLDTRFVTHNKDFVWGRRPINIEHGTTPCVFHCPGPMKWMLEHLWEYLNV